MSHWVFILYILILPWVRHYLGMSLFFLNSALVYFYFWFVGWLVFLPRHSIASTILSLNLCLLGLLWACQVLFLYSVHVAQYFCWVNSHTVLGFFSPFFSFGYPWPASFLWASLAHSFLTFLVVFAKSFELPRLNYHILYFRDLLAFAPTPFTNSFLWVPLAHFCLLSISYDSHELTTSFSRLP